MWKIILDWLEKQKKLDLEEELRYKKTVLEQRFNALPRGKYFKFLDLYDPLEFPLVITNLDVAEFLSKKRVEAKVSFDYYLKCPNCEANLSLERNHCLSCQHEIMDNPDNRYILFMKNKE